MTAPLSGTRVVEVANWVAAPSAAALLADLGADVLKVEPPAGDAMRGRLRRAQRDGQPDDLDCAFELENRGKRSIAIALDEPEGQQLVHRLLRGADVFVSNLLPERQRRFRLSPEHVRTLEPRIVYASLTAYGHRGPEADRPGFDHSAFFARGGVMSLLSEPGGAPPRLRAGQGDHMAGLNLLAAVLAALHLRARTGEGQEVEVSLLGSSAWFVGSDLAATLIDRRPPPRRKRTDARNPLLQYWRTADDRWLRLLMGDSQPHWRGFCRALGRPEWESDPRFDSAEKRAQHRDVLHAELEAVFESAPLAAWRERLGATGIPWELLAELHEVIDDPQLRANEAFAAIDHPRAGRFETVGTPFRIAGADVAVRGPAPELGAHTDAVLRELGLAPGEIERLRRAGIVGPARG